MQWELVDIGIEHSQYFQGFGVAFTEFTECAVGIGGDPREALADALDQLAWGNSTGVDADALENEILAAYPDFADADKCAAASVPADYDDDCYYHVGLRWNPAK